MAPVATAPSTFTRHERPVQGGNRRRYLIILLAVAAICALTFFWRRFWPFEPQSVIENLQEASDSRVQITTFRRTYFPSPGCVLEGVVFVHGTNPPRHLITIRKITITGSYLGIFVHHLSRINAEDMHIFIPPFGSGQRFHTTPSTITVGEIVANGASVEFASRRPDKQPLRFEIQEASLRDVGWKGPLTYRLKVHNPEPPGDIAATGQFGVWDRNDPAQTQLSGEYKFEHADLSVYKGIAGMLSSQGKFGGRLGHIDISGTTDTPDFEVESGKHPVRLTTEFRASVDGIHGDTFLERVDTRFRRTHVIVQGSVAGSAGGHGKVALLDLTASNSRIEDILGLFVESPRAPMSGPVALRAKVEIPSDDRPFLERIVLRGGFGIAGGGFSKPSTQEGVNKLSAGARGEKDDSDPETVLTDLTGQVALLNGVGNFTDLSFGVPGAAARMHGTYKVLNHRIDLHGQMRVDSKISNTSSGPKAFLLKMMDPFFKKRRKGEIVPVRISGTYEKPSFGLDLNNSKAQEVSPPHDSKTRTEPQPQ